MHLTPREQEKLMVVVAADVARRRKDRGVKLNYPESVAIITAEIFEGARDGRTVEDLMAYGATILTEDDVMEGVATLVDVVQAEATFPDGSKLVTVHHPIRPAHAAQTAHAAQAAQAATTDTPADTKLAPFGTPRGLPGELVIVNDEPVIINEGRSTYTLKVKNTGDRPVQVGSHYHFAEVNVALKFDRSIAVGCHLDIPAGTSARFEPGDEREVQLVEYGGHRTVYGFHDDWNGPIDALTPRTPTGVPHVHSDEEHGGRPAERSQESVAAEETAAAVAAAPQE